MDLYTGSQTPKTANTFSASACAGLGDGGSPDPLMHPFPPAWVTHLLFLISFPAKLCPGDTSSLILPNFIYDNYFNSSNGPCVVTHVGISEGVSQCRTTSLLLKWLVLF